MKSVPIHPYFQDVFGQEQSVAELAAIILFGLGVPVVLVLWSPEFFGSLPFWRSALALILVLDIAAGCIANFTRSTSDFYAARPRNRWIFIALHVHVLAVAFLLDADILAATWVWLYTIVGAAVVNALPVGPSQNFTGGLLLAIGLGGIALFPDLSAVMAVVFTLFMLKVLFAFAVNHYPTFGPRSDPGPKYA